MARARRRAAGAALSAAAAVVPLALLTVWAAGAWSWRAGPLALVLGGSAALLAVAGVLGRRWVWSVDERAVAAAAERERGLGDGSLRAVLELGRELPAGVSGALLHRAEQELAGRLAAPSTELTGDVGRTARRRLIRTAAGAAVLTLATVAAALVSPDRARAAWSPLLSPVAYLAGPTLPAVRVLPGDTTVDRGEELELEVQAPLRRDVTVHWRAPGDVPGARGVPVGDAGVARAAIGPIVASTRYWVTAPDGATSDTFRVDPRDPLLLSALALDVVYPAYTGLDADHYEGEVPPLRVPEGTVLRIRGRTTRPLAAAATVRSDGSEREADVTGAAFRDEWRLSPGHDGRWDWRLRGREGGEARVPGALDVTVVPDRAPTVGITVPGTDTILPAAHRQPVVADAVDDYGIRSGALVFRRQGAPDSSTVALATGPVSTRALLREVLDATGLGLVPGDAVAYYVEVTDNSPAGQTARSATYTLRLPDMADLRDRARRAAETALDGARRLADRARSLESATRDLSRSARSGGRGATGSAEERSASERLSFDDAAEARELLEDHASVLSELEAMRDRMAEVERAATEAGLEDRELRRRLDELRDLYDRIATPELRAAMEQARDAVDDLDPEAVRDALTRLAEHEEAFRRQIEESLEMLRRAAAEQEMNALARDAEELAARQTALAAAVREEPEEASPDDRVAQQEALGDGTDELSAGLEALRDELEELGEARSASAVAEARAATRRARRAMTEAAEAVGQRQGERAADRGEDAAGELNTAARTVDDARRSMAEARADRAQESVREATREALGLAEAEDELRRAMERGQQQGRMSAEARQQLRSEQAALQQSLDQLARNLSETGRRSAMLDRAVSQALEQARRDMQRTAAGMEEEGRMPIREAGEAVESLNQLAMSLLQNDGRIQQAREGGESIQQALQRMAELAREQGALNGQVGALAPMELARRTLERQLQELARRQQRIAEGMDEVGGSLSGREDVLGQVDELAGEAADLARALGDGRLDPEIRARQERLFHRLLDAGRSLERDEYSDERVGERPGEAAGVAPAPLDPALLDTGRRYPVPTPAQLRGLPPAYRALVLEYFERLNRGGDAGGSPDSDGGSDGGSGDGSATGSGGGSATGSGSTP